MERNSTVITVGLPAEMLTATPQEIREIIRAKIGSIPGENVGGYKVNKAIRVHHALGENIRFFADHYQMSVTDYTYHLLLLGV